MTTVSLRHVLKVLLLLSFCLGSTVTAAGSKCKKFKTRACKEGGFLGFRQNTVDCRYGIKGFTTENCEGPNAFYKKGMKKLNNCVNVKEKKPIKSLVLWGRGVRSAFANKEEVCVVQIFSEKDCYQKDELDNTFMAWVYATSETSDKNGNWIIENKLKKPIKSYRWSCGLFPSLQYMWKYDEKGREMVNYPF
jgi:hypothetical protein